MIDHDAFAWPASRVVEALEVVAAHCRLPTTKTSEVTPTWGTEELDARSFDRWVEAGAASLGIDAEPIDVEHSEVESLLLRAAPALVRAPPNGPFFAIIGRRGRSIVLLTPELEVRAVPVSELKNALCRTLEAPFGTATDTWLLGLIDDSKRRARVRTGMVGEILRGRPVTRGYLMRPLAGSGMLLQMRFEGILSRAFVLAFAYAIQYALGLAAWYALGSGAFGGVIERDWLILWALLLVSAIPIQVLGTWMQGQILRTVSTLMKRRLLLGTLRVDQDALRRAGAGQLLGRALDASAVEALALSGGLFAVLALVEFIVLAVVMALGSGGVSQSFALIAWGVLTLGIGWQCYSRNKRWSDARREMTSDLVEQMVGHRTRLAQQAPSKWHEGEDETLERYLAVSNTMDRKDAHLMAMPRAWYLVGLATLLPSFLRGSTSVGGLAVAIGGVVLGGAALSRMAGGIAQIAAAATAWVQVKPLYDAAARRDIEPSPEVIASQLASRGDVSDPSIGDVPIIDATDLVFSYPGRPQPVLRGGTLHVRIGDRILLEGPSGGGKSTFASLLSGLRQPSSGLLLLEGLDWQTVGPRGWRRLVAAAPQYHDNHILSETFLFNLLMGRDWPPSPEDTREAEKVCRELGLGDLIRRMPAGLMQMVGDTGWRLSHGERSRVFMARALLQGAKVIVLDESFAALDPKTVEQCLRCVLERAPSLVVIAHP